MGEDFIRQTDSGRRAGFLASWIALAWWSKPVLPNQNWLHAQLNIHSSIPGFTPHLQPRRRNRTLASLPCTFLRRRPPGSRLHHLRCLSVSTFPGTTYKPGKVLSNPETSYLSWRVIGVTGGKFIIWRSECQRAERCKNGGKKRCNKNDVWDVSRRAARCITFMACSSKPCFNELHAGVIFFCNGFGDEINLACLHKYENVWLVTSLEIDYA